MTTTFSRLTPDRPLAEPSADLLDRVAFAERIAAELGAWKGREHLVVSVNGEAGSGKTTLKNFIRHQLTVGAAPGPAAVVVEFDPWRCLAHEDMGRRLCTEMAEQLERQKEIEGTAQLSASWRQLAAAGGSQPDAVGTASGRAGWESIGQQLGALPVPLILFVDDLDRGTNAEIQQLLRLLQTHTAFSNVICFLLFSRAAIVRALDDGIPGRGAESLRKLVQIEFELPEPSEPLLRGQLEKGLSEIIETATFPTYSRERWHDVFTIGIWPLFATPRDVKRFLSAFSFQFAAHFEPHHRVLEVNPLDLAALETLRMFAHSVYRELREMFRRREARLVRLMSGRDDERKEARSEIDQLVDRLPLCAREKRAVAATLHHILPMGGTGVQGTREDWDRDLRLCSPRHSERYFHLGAIRDALPAYRLIELVRAMGDRAKLEGLLLQAVRENVISEVLERLPALLGGLPESHIVPSASALCTICDRIPAGAPEDVESRAIRLAAELFARLPNPLKRENAITELIDDPARLTGPILLLQQLRPRPDLPVGGGTTSLSVEQFRRVVQPAVARLQAGASDGAIWRSREYGALIRRWWEWSGSKDEVRSWLLDQVIQPEHACAWLRTFLAPAPNASAGETTLQLEELGQFCDPALVAAAAAKATSTGLDRAAVRALLQAMGARNTSANAPRRTLVVKLEAEAA